MAIRVSEFIGGPIVVLLACSFFLAGTFYVEKSFAEESPEIQIRYGEDETIYEYRVQGELVEIKIVPKVGPTYYLVPDTDGDFVRSDTSRLVYPSWKILEW